MLFRGPMIDVYEKIFGEAVSHLDYRWLRIKRPADPGALPDVTPPHCDLVYMGRGSLDLLTSWTCFSDVGYDMGGLVLLEGGAGQGPFEDLQAEHLVLDGARSDKAVHHNL